MYKMCYFIFVLISIPTMLSAQTPQFVYSFPGKDTISSMSLTDGRLYFLADTGTRNRPWVTDGTKEGTHSIDLLVSKNESQIYDAYSEKVGYGKLVYSLLHEPTGSNYIFDLILTDGTQYGSKRLNRFPIPYGVMRYDFYHGDLYFSYKTDEYGDEFYKADTMGNGLQIVKDIEPGPSSSLASLVFILNDLMYLADADLNGVSLYKSDGTEQGTMRACTIPAVGVSNGGFIHYKDLICFDGKDDEHFIELWVTDGTQDGTRMLFDLNKGDLGSYPQWMCQNGDKLYFMANNGSNGWQLYGTDENLENPYMVKKLGGYPEQLISVNGLLYFVAYKEQNIYCLYCTDGTESGTKLLLSPSKDNYISFKSLTKFNNKLYFLGDSVLYETDGTVEGTRKLLDSGNVEFSHCGELTTSDKVLYFTRNKQEIWKIETPTDVCETITPNKPEFNIFPNPASDFIMVDFGENTELKSFVILDLSGKIVYSRDMRTRNAVIPLDDLQSGMYFVKVEDCSFVVVKKLVVDK